MGAPPRFLLGLLAALGAPQPAGGLLAPAEFLEAQADAGSSVVQDPLLGLSRSVPANLVEYYQRLTQLKKSDIPWLRSSKRFLQKKMVVGVFTSLLDSERSAHIRRLVRYGWMAHPDVCTYRHEFDGKMREGPYEGCTIHVVFVSGRPPMVRRQYIWEHPQTDLEVVNVNGTNLTYVKHEPDVLVLPIEENMDKGKTFAWFEFAANFFPWADFIAKADDDTYLHAYNIIESLPIGKDKNGNDFCPNSYLGRPWTCMTDDSVCPPAPCGPPVGHDFLAYAPWQNEFKEDNVPSWKTALPEGPRCWCYMQGAFYSLSKSIVRDITRPSGYFSANRVGFEDALTGTAVIEYAARTRQCVHIWDGQDITAQRMLVHLSGVLKDHPGVHGSEVWRNYTQWW